MKSHTLRMYVMGVVAFVILATGMFLTESGKCQEPDSTLTGNTFRMAMNRPVGSPIFTWTELIYKEVFRRLDIKLEMSYYPSKRSSMESDAGNLDGEPVRIHAYAASHPNMVRVEETVFPMTVLAYTAAPSTPKLNGWESLRNTEYFVEYHRGMKACEINLSKVVKAERLSTVTKVSQGLRKLTAKRIDLYIDHQTAVIPVLQNKEYELEGKVHLAGVMEAFPLYMYVHKKHRALAPKLADAIKAIKADGLVDRYREIAFAPIKNKSE